MHNSPVQKSLLSFWKRVGSTRALSIYSLSVALAGCLQKSGDEAAPPADVADYPDSLLTEFLEWTPVLDGDVAFSSSGHSGQTVRVFFNKVAKAYFEGKEDLPFAPGSYVAKAVVADSETDASEASRVYFMLKKDDGFDSANANWSYAVANRTDGELVFGSTQGKDASCSDCHGAESKWDYVRTVDYFQRQTTE